MGQKRRLAVAQFRLKKTAETLLFERFGAASREASPALAWKLNGPSFQELRAHPAVAGVQIETKRLELKQERRWAKRN